MNPMVYEGPHSRACGVYQHPHGLNCHENCPTCHGQLLPLPTADDVKPPAWVDGPTIAPLTVHEDGRIDGYLQVGPTSFTPGVDDFTSTELFRLAYRHGTVTISVSGKSLAHLIAVKGVLYDVADPADVTMLKAMLR